MSTRETIQRFLGTEGGSINPESVLREPRKITDKYKPSSLSYPMDMGVDSNTEFDNQIIFDIYVDETTSFKSLKFDPNGGEPTSYRAPAGQTAGSTNIGQKLKSQLETDASNAGDLIANGVGSISETAKKYVEGFNSSVGKVSNEVFKGPRKMKKLNRSIALAVPNTFTSTSTATYTESKLGQMAGAYSRAGGISGLVDSFSTDATGTANRFGGDAARMLLEGALKVPDMFGMNLQNILEVSTRRVANPHVEQRFESMQFREFQFVYEFSARSKAEADQINEIIKTFRFHMHPELVESGLYFMYPSLFDLSVMFKDGNNPYIHKISTCVLTSCTVNYTSTGVFSTNRDGQPTEIQVTMSFKEIEPMTKHRVAEGF